MIDNFFLSYNISRAAFHWALSANLCFSLRIFQNYIKELSGGKRKFYVDFVVHILDNFVGHSLCFVGLDLKKKRIPTAYVSYLFFLYCYSFVSSYKYCLKVLSLIHFPLLSLWSSSQICSWKDGPFQFSPVKVCTLGPSPYGWCHWLAHHLLQVWVTFFKRLNVKIN